MSRRLRAESLEDLARFEEGMNPEQVEAIRHQDGPCRLLAVAGAGKTKTLVHRVARLVASGVSPSAILAVTFSVKAAGEMNSRLRLLGISGARVGTWHSLCLQFLKEDRTRWSDWEIDEHEKHRTVLKEVLGYRGMDWKQADATAVGSYIGKCKANLFEPGTVEALELAVEESVAPQQADEAHRRYNAAIEERRLLTYDDFIVFAHRHLSDEETRERWAGKWLYMLTDETQDNNGAQEAITEMLCRAHRNLLVVGDVAQAIYSFRGSDPAYLDSFAERWGAKSIAMNRNYRCAGAIVRVANDIIRLAAIRMPVDMVAERELEGSAEVLVATNFDAEGENFGAWVEGLVRDGGKLSDCCALFRTNAQSRALEEAMLSRKMPYVVVGGTSFYERKEVKDLLGYLRVALDRDADGDAMRRCINAPFRYLGKAFVDRVLARRGDGTWLDAARAAASEPGVQGRQRESVFGWSSLVATVAREISEGKKPAEILNAIISRTRYVEWLEKEEGQESVHNSRSSNVRELARVAERFATAAELLDYIDATVKAARKQRDDKQAGGERVLLMSVHKSKGLEFKNVFVSGCNEKILPHARGDIEEERRLMYVAVTRARDALVLSYVEEFVTRTGIVQAEPSRFLRDAGLVDEYGSPVRAKAIVAEVELTAEKLDAMSGAELEALAEKAEDEIAAANPGIDTNSDAYLSLLAGQPIVDGMTVAERRSVAEEDRRNPGSVRPMPKWLGDGTCHDCDAPLATHGETCAT